MHKRKKKTMESVADPGGQGGHGLRRPHISCFLPPPPGHWIRYWEFLNAFQVYAEHSNCVFCHSFGGQIMWFQSLIQGIIFRNIRIMFSWRDFAKTITLEKHLFPLI